MDEYHLFVKSAFLDSNFRYLCNDEKYFDVPIICAIVQVTFNASGFSTIVTKNIRVNVIDDSDESDDGPVFEKGKYETNVTENAAMGTMIQQVSATDRTSSDNARIEYRLDNNYYSTFAIDSVTGEIFVYGMIDHENITMYILRVLAIDQSSPRLTGYASVRVYVMDVNDNIPQFTKEKFVFEVPRDVSVGTEVGRVTAEDKDSGEYGELYYSLYDGSAMRNVPFVVMGDGVILTDATLDSDESVYRYKFLVVVVDALNDPINCRRNYVEVFVKILD
ncbi:hypothetical protein FSP39_024361 [Pinctada imbricata]|uniref:Cadherin domain-containing protein n=1 Tax=Pinctada imbricata TaxID=66713 RepID=A0AA89C9D2_PINIB|nr:hypothetical protein FSP39_024361 [Pinctada imbricata]